MRTIRIFTALAAMLATSVANASAFVPIVREGVQWVYYDHCVVLAEDGNGNYGEQGEYNLKFYPVVYEFKGDTLINGHRFLRLWEDRTRFDRRTGDVVMRTDSVVAFACWEEDYTMGREMGGRMYALRNGPAPLTGQFQMMNDGWYGYLVYTIDHFPVDFVSSWDRVPLTRDGREQVFNFTGVSTIEVNGTERRCHTTDVPHRMFIEGIGYVITDFDNRPYCPNFLDLNLTGPQMRVLSHVIEDGEIVFKGERYDYIQQFLDEDPEDGVGVDDVPVRQAVVDGVTYDLQGRRVADTDAPGIYIRDGRKVAVTR